MTRPVTVLVLTPSIGGFYFGEVLAGIGREVTAAGGRLVLVQTDDGTDGSASIASPVGWAHIDGAVAVTTAVPAAFLRQLRDAGKPVVLVSSRPPGFEAPTAVPDNRGGTLVAVQHLIAHGHRRIGFVGNLAQPDVRDRHDAYVEALRRHGLVANPALLFEASDMERDGGVSAAHRVLQAAEPPTAMMVATDRNAIGLMNTLTAAGWNIPRDMAVIGFDNIEAAAYSSPALSSVDQRFDEVGALAGRLLLAQFRGEKVAFAPHVPSSAQLELRASCGCPGKEPRPSAEQDGDALGDAQHRAGALHRQIELTERALEEQFVVDAAFLGADGCDPCRLGWLAHTHVRTGVLALWEESSAEQRLHVAGWYDADDMLPELAGLALAPEDFPPPALIDAARFSDRRVCIVAPVSSKGREWGLLAVIGELRSTSTTLEPYRHWASQLSAYLEQQTLQEAVRANEERYALASQATNDGLWEWNVRNGDIFMSDRCCTLLGLDPHPETDRLAAWEAQVHPEDRPAMRRCLQAVAIGETQTGTFTQRVRAADGSFRWVLGKAIGVASPGGPVARVVGSMSDIHEQRLLEEQLRASALHDPLTGLPNRRLFLNQLDHAIELWRRSRTPFAVIFLDLDRFKPINDSLGHPTGDQVLTALAVRLQSELRSVDIGARFGGDEFAILLHSVHRDDVLKVACRIQRRLAEPIELDGHAFSVGASFGIATSSDDYTNAEDVLRDADIAMYHAKEHGRGSISFFDSAKRACVSAPRELDQANDVPAPLDDATGVLAPRDDATGVLAPRDDATGVLAPLDQAAEERGLPGVL